jgi:hypothetical protein
MLCFGLVGSIPTELGALINMDLLSLADNQLTGTLCLFMLFKLVNERRLGLKPC